MNRPGRAPSAPRGLVSIHILKERKMSISLNAEQTATRQTWLQSLKVGDPLVVFYNWSEKDGRIDAVVVQHDHGWISVVPRNKKDMPSNRMKYCELSGQDPHS